MKVGMRFLGVLAVVLWMGVLPAQQREGGRTTVHIEHADYMEGAARFGKNVQALFGNVRFRHHQTLMHCDSAFFYRDSNMVHAYGSVHVIQNDSIHLYGDVLYYRGNEDKAMVRENVRLVNKNVVLTTEFLDYDRRTDVAYYYNGGPLPATTTNWSGIGVTIIPEQRRRIFARRWWSPTPITRCIRILCCIIPSPKSSKLLVPPPSSASATLYTQRPAFTTRKTMWHSWSATVPFRAKPSCLKEIPSTTTETMVLARCFPPCTCKIRPTT